MIIPVRVAPSFVASVLRQFALVALGLCVAQPALAEYRLGPGDVLEVSVAGLPEFRHRVTVQLDGSISLPLLGTLYVAGSPPSEARSRIQSTLATKVVRQRRTDGRDSPLMVEIDEVSAVVVEYRPIYVGGDVTRSGEQTYRPLMTVRQALATSGGYDPRAAALGTFRDLIDLQAEYGALSISFAKEHIQAWRIRTELGGMKADFDRSVLGDLPLSPAKISELVQLVKEHIGAREADLKSERTNLKAALTDADEQIVVLSKQLETERQGTEADLEDLKRVNLLFEKGALAITRVTEARRAVMLSSSRALETNAHLIQVRKQRNELMRQIEKVDSLRKVELLKELEETTVRLAAAEAKLKATLVGLQNTLPPMTSSEASQRRRITIFRKTEDGDKSFVATGDTELLPGDVVEVTIRRDEAEVAGAPVARTTK
jgi:polysaccharide biosynthesis/export protein